jgi:hypothetical protein
MFDSRSHPNSHPNALEHSADHGVSRLDFEYHWLRRRLVELHSSEQKNPAAIDAVMRKLDETRSAVRAAHPQL